MGKRATESRLPAFDHPPHLSWGGGELAIWFTEPWGMLTQMLRPTYATETLANFIADFAYSALLELRDTTTTPLIFVHDFSRMTGYESEARKLLTMWGFRIRSEIERVVVVQPPVKNELARLGISAAASALGVVGIRFEIVETVQAPIDRYGLSPRKNFPG